jgi:hypothetical protein
MVMRGAPKRSARRPAGTPVSAAASGQSDQRRAEPERTGEIERPHHQRRHYHRRDERAHREAGAQHRIAEHRQADHRRCGARLGEHEEAHAEDRGPQQCHVEPTEMAAPDRHGEGIGRERQRQQQRAHVVEAGPIIRRRPPINRQVAMGEQERQGARRHADEENGPPAETGDQHPAERWTERGADRGRRAEQPHGAADPGLRNRLPDQGDGEGHHDGRAEALRRPGGDQQPERGRDAAQDRGGREQADAGQQQPPLADDVTEPSDADDQGGDGEEIGEDDPLDCLEGGVESQGQRR